MDAIELLEGEHRTIEELFEALESGGDRPALMILAQLRIQLATHAQLEEEVFYPAVRESTIDAPRLIDSAKEDHEQVSMLLEDLAYLDSESDEFHRLLRMLRVSVRSHVVMEESRIFAEARRGLDQADLVRLALEMEALRNDLISRPADERRLTMIDGVPIG